MSPRSIGLFVRAARERKSMSRQQLADLIAHSATWLYRFESGERTRPTSDTLQAISDALHLKPWERRYMLLLAGEMPHYDAIECVDEVAVQAYVDRLLPHPAAWVFASRTLGNAEITRLFKGVEDYSNITEWAFSSHQAPAVIRNYDEVGDWLVAATRFWTALNPDDPLLDSFIKSASSADEFGRRWAEQIIPADPGPRIWHLTDLDRGRDFSLDVRLWQTTLRHGALLVGVPIPSS